MQPDSMDTRLHLLTMAGPINKLMNMLAHRIIGDRAAHRIIGAAGETADSETSSVAYPTLALLYSSHLCH